MNALPEIHMTALVTRPVDVRNKRRQEWIVLSHSSRVQSIIVETSQGGATGSCLSFFHSQRQRKMNVGVRFDFSFLTRESRMTLPTFRTVFSS